jgi:hypothetical protein
MATHHGARQQKKIAKQKAKRAARRSSLSRRTSKDPTIRLRQAAKWPVAHAFVSANLWKDGIGSLVIARQDSEDGIVFAVFLVDIYCLGVKDAFWRAGSSGEFQTMVERIEESQTLSAITPACLVKIIQGAIAYAHSFGFSPHPDYHHAAMLLEGIDSAACPQEFQFGRDGKPFYFQGPNETDAQAEVIMQRVQEAGGHLMVGGPVSPVGDFDELEDESDEFDALDDNDSSDDEDDPSDELPGIPGGPVHPNPWLR